MASQGVPLLGGRQRRVAQAASLTSIFVGVAVVVGWLGDVSWLKSPLPGSVTMRANAAAAFAILGTSLYLLTQQQLGSRKRRLAQALAILVVLVGLTTLGEYLAGRSLGIDQWLASDPAVAYGTSHPGRMSPATSLNFILLGCAIVWLDVEMRRGLRPSECLASVAGLVALLALVGYLYGVKSLYEWGNYSNMAVHTAATFILLSGGIFFARPDRGLMRILNSSTSGGRMARVLLPIVIGLPVLLGWIRLQGERLGLYETEFGLALFAVSNIVIFAAVVWCSALLAFEKESERERIRRSLEESEQRFQAFMDNSPVVAFMKDEEGRYVYVNKPLERVFRLPLADLRGKTDFDVWPAETARRLGENDRVALGSDRPVETLEAVPTPSGGVRDWTVLKFPVREASGRTLLGGVALDVTAQRQAERKFRDLLESAPDAIVIVNQAGEIVLVNSQAERLFGYSRQELLGQAIELLIPHRFRARHVGLRSNYFAAPRVRGIGAALELCGLRKDGREFPAEIMLGPVATEDGLLMSAAVRDVSVRKLAEAELKRTAGELARSNAELERFAYVSSHDLQEPLRMVASYVQLLERRYQGQLDQEADAFIGYAVEGVNRMQQLINDLLTFSRVSIQAKPPEPTPCEAAFERAVANLQMAVIESGAVVTHETLPTVIADPTQMVQLFQNLIGNAIKFRNHQPPEVHVRAERQGEEWVFSVRDNGIGLEAKYAERIFALFQRLHGRDKYPGTGIGLAICQKIVERHGGRIWVESQPDKGSTFYFTLLAKGENEP